MKIEKDPLAVLRDLVEGAHQKQWSTVERHLRNSGNRFRMPKVTIERNTNLVIVLSLGSVWSQEKPVDGTVKFQEWNLVVRSKVADPIPDTGFFAREPIGKGYPLCS